MASPSFLPGGSGGNGGIQPVQEQQPDALHDMPAGGPGLPPDMPSIAVPGGMPMTLNGYTPNPGRDPLPTPGT